MKSSTVKPEITTTPTAQSVAQVAKQLNIGVRTVRQLIYTGQMGCLKVGRRVLVTAEQLAQYVHSNSQHAR